MMKFTQHSKISHSAPMISIALDMLAPVVIQLGLCLLCFACLAAIVALSKD
jgi:hypothetical protein